MGLKDVAALADGDRRRGAARIDLGRPTCSIAISAGGGSIHGDGLATNSLNLLVLEPIGRCFAPCAISWLGLVDRAPPLKSLFIRAGRGVGRRWMPRLLKGEAL